MQITKTQFYIIQFNAAILVVGFLFGHGLFSIFTSNPPASLSILLRGIQLIISLYVLVVCRKYLFVSWNKFFLAFFQLSILLYSLRFFYDVMSGPFVNKVTPDQFLDNFLQLIVSLFISTISIISSRRYLHINTIAKIVFWCGMLIIFSILLFFLKFGFILQDDRLEIGGAFGVLQLVKMSSIVAISGIHVMLNFNRKRYLYISGIILAIIVGLLTGARGGIVGLAISLLTYLIMSSRKNRVFFLMSVCFLFIIYVNIVPILEFLGIFFPIFSNRMLETIVDNESSNRDILFTRAWELINDNPLFGYSYRLNADETGYGCHNGLLDIMLALGIPFGIVFASVYYIYGVIISAKMMISKEYMFPTVMYLFAIISSLSSSGITNEPFNFSICLLASVYYYHWKDQHR